MARSSASEPRITLVMGFGGDADVGVLRDVSMLRIERGSGTSASAPEADILLRHNLCRRGPTTEVIRSPRLRARVSYAARLGVTP